MQIRKFLCNFVVTKITCVLFAHVIFFYYLCTGNTVPRAHHTHSMTISIIIATYNSEATLASTFDSILSQTYRDYEVIVQDGQSKDGTLDIVRAYEQLFEGRMKWQSVPDSGIYDGFNKGCKRAQGDVIGFLNSDDLFASADVLSNIAQAYASHPDIDAVYADVVYVPAKNVNKVVRHYSSRKFKPSRMRMGYIPAHPTLYIKSECYKKYGYYDTDFKLAADFEFILRLVYLNNIKTHYVPQIWVKMRLGGATTKGIKSCVQGIKDHFKALRKHNIPINPVLYFWRYAEKLFEFRPFNR